MMKQRVLAKKCVEFDAQMQNNAEREEKKYVQNE